MPDIFATIQFLVIVASLGVVFNDPLRREGTIVILMTWIASNTCQMAFGTLVPSGWFAAIDLIALVWFCWIAVQPSYVESVDWAWWGVISFFTSLCLHFFQYLFHWPSDFWYVSILNGLAYIALFAILAGPVSRLIKRIWEHGMVGSYSAIRRVNHHNHSTSRSGNESAQ